ncbi:hypothetical protein Y1Q_0024255 [Alligator mississippiensis]|uniref:Uncharacterized protein n=1 Tax=Alligator mississippiensis TaxID=8496 RepID=A0A151NIG1_ALLMI|nr:hypothetical protein Y1Q_0024255 [Alligator mississippiensis]
MTMKCILEFSISCPLIRKRKEMPYHVPNPILHPFTTQINLVAPFSLKSQTGIGKCFLLFPSPTEEEPTGSPEGN